MPPAARMSDMHTCPLATPGTPPVPHVGGPIIKGAITVKIGFLPSARMSDMCTCVGPPDSIIRGSMTVKVEYLPAARMGDNTAHGGVIVAGCPTVMIGDVGMAGTTIPEINAALDTINANNGTVNCGNIIDEAIDYVRGEEISTVTTARDGSWAAINARLGTNIDPTNATTFDAIYDDLESRGPGSMTLVSTGNGGHVVVAANIDGHVGIMEGQNWSNGDRGFITDRQVAADRYGSGTVASSPIPDAAP